MTKTIVLFAAAALAVICLGAAAALLVLAFQVRGNPLPWVRTQSLQAQARASACPPSGSVVPGSFQASPPQNVGNWTVQTYTAACDVPGQPRQPVRGFYAIDHAGSGCGGWEPEQALSAPGGPLTIASVIGSSCGGPGTPASLSVTSGTLSGPGAVTVRALFAGGASASAAIQVDHFFIAAPGDRTLCAVQALDANGSVLAETLVATPGQGGCP
jgi:hypothetical protein